MDSVGAGLGAGKRVKKSMRQPGSAASTRVRRTGAYAVCFAVFQILVFGVCFHLGRPSWYALFLPVSVMLTVAGLRREVFATVMATAGSLLLVAVGLPLVMFIARQDPSLVWQEAQDPAVHRTLYLAVYAPFLAALVALGLGVPLGLTLARGFPGSSVVQSLVDLPLVVPHSVAGLMVLFAFGQEGMFPDLKVLGTLLGMVLALIFVSSPYAVNGARQAFEAVPRRLEYAARVHGAGSARTFFRVSLPMAWRGVLVGGVLAWARAVSEFGAVAIVAYSVSFFFPFAGHRVVSQHAPVFIYNTYLAGSLARAGAVGVLLLIISAIVFLLIRWLMAGSDYMARFS